MPAMPARLHRFLTRSQPRRAAPNRWPPSQRPVSSSKIRWTWWRWTTRRLRAQQSISATFSAAWATSCARWTS
jgi:hypothetical protein